MTCIFTLQTLKARWTIAREAGLVTSDLSYCEVQIICDIDTRQITRT